MSKYVLLDTEDDGQFGTYIQGPNKEGHLLIDGWLKLIITSDSLNTIATYLMQTDREAAHHQRLSGRVIENDQDEGM